MARKKEYYDISNMLKTDAQYMILLGQRANGKSYQAKTTVIKDAYLNGKRFVYLRRWDNHIKAHTVENYFNDINISELTKGEYDGVCAWNGEIFFTITGEDGKRIKAQPIGYYCALNLGERYKSNVFENVNYIIFEEFITDGAYLVDEPRRLQQFVSTVLRHSAGHVIMVGNTLSRVCPYLMEWALEPVLRQKQGTIEVYHFHAGETVIDVAVEMCANNIKENKMFFGSASKQIVSGEWDVHDAPHLPRTQLEYEMVYEIELKYGAFRFCLQLLVEPKEGGCIVFVYPLTKKRKFLRVITNVFSDSPLITSCLDPAIRAEAVMIKCIKLNKVCFSDNLTASDFKSVMSNMKIC